MSSVTFFQLKDESVKNDKKDATDDFKPKFEMRHSCVEETRFYEVDRERLLNNFGGVFTRSLDDDPCHSGIFLLTPVADTDLLLLVFDDFQDLSGNATNRPCQKFKRQESNVVAYLLKMSLLKFNLVSSHV